MKLTKGEQTKQRVIETATELFWRRSYHGVNMAEIAKAAGVNKATLYQYFASKEALCEAVILHTRERTTAYVYEETFLSTNDPLARLEGIFQRVYDTHAEVMSEHQEVRGCPFINIVSEMATVNDNIRQLINESFEKFREYYLQIVQQLNSERAGRLSEDAAADALVKLMHGAVVQAKIARDPKVLLDTIPDAKQLALS